jgi:acyl-CoA thioester hydrolase
LLRSVFLGKKAERNAKTGAMGLEGFPIVVTIPVLWGDQDLFGHVNNTVHFRWFESARVRYWDDTGIRQQMAQDSVGPILAFASCDYRRQLDYPDTVDVGARVTRLGRTSMTMQYQLFSRKLEAIAAEGDSVVVVFDYAQQKPVPISQALRDLIASIEGRTL